MFRWIAVAVVATAFVISGVHRSRARTARPDPRRGDEPLRLKLLRAAVALPAYAGFLAYAVNPEWMAWGQVALPAWLRWTGVGLAVAALPLIVWLFRHLGESVSATVFTGERQPLVTSGPYRWMRHPLYSAGMLLWTGVSLMAASWFFLLFVVLFALTWTGVIIPREEAELMDRFGDEYVAYRERTGGLVPRLFGMSRAALPCLLVMILAACPGEEDGGAIGDAPGDTLSAVDAAGETTPGETTPTADTTGADTGDSQGELDRRVGTLHPPVPEGVEKRAGALVTRPGQDAADAELGLTHAVAEGTRQLWLSELLRREPDGTPVWRVVDVVEVGRVGPDERVLIMGCRSADRDWGVAAVMTDEDEETLTDARRAWRVEEAPGRLEPIPTEGVRCRNEGLNTP